MVISMPQENSTFPILRNTDYFLETKNCLGFMAGSVIQATGRTDFEDGPRIGNQSEAGNSLQRVRTIPEND